MGKKMPKTERRYVQVDDLELREDGDEPVRLVGYAAVFNQEVIVAGMWRELVEPGTFKKTIQENDIRALLNHDPNIVLGRNKAGTLKLSEDERGLRVEIYPPDTQAGRDAVTNIRRGDISQMSITFQAIKQKWEYPRDKEELGLRRLKEARLLDVSPVTFPAFEMTSISARSALEPEAEQDPREEALRLVLAADHGMELTNEQRRTVAEAMEMYEPYLPEPGVEANHSGPVGEPEQDGHYSTIERMRKLEDLSRAYGLPL